MIRIDEIYHQVFGTYLQRNVPRTRFYHCAPFGHTGVENLCVSDGAGSHELNYILFHDQEPIHLDLHAPLFDAVRERSRDLNNHIGPRSRALVHSEMNSDAVRAACERWGWKSYYYFFHGWAALDWFRGYDRTWLRPQQSRITHSFLAPNRIIGGRRRHRVTLMYHLLRGGVRNAHVSFPATCPQEGVAVQDLVDHLPEDAASVFARAGLPWNFAGERDHPMRSYELTQWHEAHDSLAYVVTETVYAGARQHLTEKTFKPVALGRPFVLLAAPGSLEYLRSYGFRTFHDVWDESYDLEPNDDVRAQRVADLLLWMDQRTDRELRDLNDQCRDVVQHNHQHFYGGAFEEILWRELTAMLKQIRDDFND